MSREKALERLKQIESETKELRKIIETPEKLIGVVNTISEVYKRLGRKELTIEDFAFLPENKRVKALNFQHIQVLEELFNEDWKTDWTNNNEYKWYPYFEFKKGSDCWCFCIACDRSCSSLIVPAFYKSREITEYIGKTFLNIYSDYINN